MQTNNLPDGLEYIGDGWIEHDFVEPLFDIANDPTEPDDETCYQDDVIHPTCEVLPDGRHVFIIGSARFYRDVSKRLSVCTNCLLRNFDID